MMQGVKMKIHKLISYITLFISLSALSVNSQSVKFLLKDPAVRDTFRYYSTYKLDFTALIKIKTGESQGDVKSTYGSTKESIANVTILGVKNKAANKFEVFYEKVEEISKEGETQQKKSEAVSGKTYVVDIKDNEKVIIYKDNKNEKPGQAELDYIDVEELTNSSGFYDVIRDIEFKPGDKVPKMEEKLLAYLTDSTADAKVKNVEVIFKNTKNINNMNYGVFGIKFDTDLYSDSSGAMAMTMILEGELVVLINDLNVFELKLEGKMNMASDTAAMTLTGEGPVLFNLKREYLKK
jgi:hypothetical protein